MEKRPLIVFDDSVKEDVIDALGFEIDSDNKLISSDGKLATSQDFESINVEEFGGVLQGSKIPIKNEESEIVQYFICKVFSLF